jgi:hypothetical protein
MGRKRRERREALRRQTIEHETAPVLRLVRPEEPVISSEPNAAGFSGAALSGIPQFIGGEPDGGEEAGPDHVVSAADSRTSDVPRLIKRSFDAAEINALFNDPAAFPFLAVPGADHIDVSQALQNDGNIGLVGGGCAALFCSLGPNTYDLSAAFPSLSLSEAISWFRAMLHFMFIHTDCVMIMVKVPLGHPLTEILETSAVLEFERPEATFWTIRYDDWIRTADLSENGELFCQKLAQEFAKFSAPLSIYTGEHAQQIRLGAFSEMLFGQFEKAVFLYNRFAAFGGYAPIELVSHRPKLIRFGAALIQITDETFKVVQIRRS